MLPCHAVKRDIISGGEILSQIDLCATIVAATAISDKELGMVSRAMNEVEFKEAVRVGDVLSCYGTVAHVGRTSVTVSLEVEVLRRKKIIKVTEATAVLVAVDENGRATPINGERNIKAAAINDDKHGCSSPVSVRPFFFPAPAKPETILAASINMPREGDRIIALKKMMMPYETNGMGKIFGGRLMACMEGAGSFLAEQACDNPELEACVTRYMDKIEFRQPVEVNDILSCYGVLTRIGKTSVSVHVEAEVERLGQVIPVTSASLVFVAVNQLGAKIPVRGAVLI